MNKTLTKVGRKAKHIVGSIGEEARTMVPSVYAGGLGVVGGFVGYELAKKSHPVLGSLSGAIVGLNLLPLIKGRGRDLTTWRNIAVESAVVLGALAYKKQPILGAVVGAAAVGVGTQMVSSLPPWVR